MKKLITIRLMFLLVVGITGLYTSLFSQNTCPPATETGCTGWNGPTTLLLDMFQPDCEILFSYKWRICNGVTEYSIDAIQHQGTCDAFASLNIYHYNISAFFDACTQLFLEKVLSSQMPPVVYPDCGQGPGPKLVRIYTASCGIWVTCEYEINPESRNCDRGVVEPFPDGGTSKVYIGKWQSCGTTCCRREFEYCMEPSTIPYYTGKIKVAKLTKKERLYPCSDQAKYDPKPCQDGC